MRTIRRFEELKVWKKARELAALVYTLTRSENFREDMNLSNQMRDCCVSVMANVAEGFSRNSDKEFRRFLFIAKGSGAELQSHSYVALDQKYLNLKDFEKLYENADHTCRMLSNLIKYLSKPIAKDSKDARDSKDAHAPVAQGIERQPPEL